MNEYKKPIVTRRKAIQGAVALVGGSVAVAQFGTLMSRAALATDESSTPVFFDGDQFSLLERVVDVMIPETDTPGAHGVGVHYFIDLMMSEWASPERQERYIGGLRDVNARLRELGQEQFVSASPAKQLEALRELDEKAFAVDESDAVYSFYREFKKLVLFSYYSSEAGANVELQYEALTPEYKACVPIEDIGRAWFWLGFSHGL